MSRVIQSVNVATGQEEIVTKSNEDMGWTPLTDAEISANKLEFLRLERNSKLAETDHWGLSDTATMTQEQTDYRQALRDITNSYTSLDDVVWPTKP